MEEKTNNEKKELVKKIQMQDDQNCSLYADESGDPLANGVCYLYTQGCYLFDENCHNW